MDYRHTEDFARCMEAAESHARMLREQAIDAFFAAIARAVRAAWIRIVHHRSDDLLPEA
jgi:L-aminopeptidase/D-esterase-like protein